MQRQRMGWWRMLLFRLMHRRERRAGTYFGIPSDRVIEVEHRTDL
jgi:K+ transporter